MQRFVLLWRDVCMPHMARVGIWEIPPQSGRGILTWSQHVARLGKKDAMPQAPVFDAFMPRGGPLGYARFALIDTSLAAVSLLLIGQGDLGACRVVVVGSEVV